MGLFLYLEESLYYNVRDFKIQEFISIMRDVYKIMLCFLDFRQD